MADPNRLGVDVAGLLCLVIAIIDIVDVLSRDKTDVFGVTIGLQVEWGLWMVAISSATLAATATVVAVQGAKGDPQDIQTVTIKGER